MCTLPQYPPHGKYNATNGTLPGDIVSYSLLLYSCDRGYSLSGSNIHYCISSTWSSEEPTCEVKCAPLKSISVDFKCYKQRSTLEISCESPQDNISSAKVTCKNSYHSEVPLRNPRCVQGNWDYVPHCTPECGILAPEGNMLAIGGKDAKIGQFPWHIGLYVRIGNRTRQICGGSIFHPKLVVTAAHCVYKDGIGLNPAFWFAVAAGKIHRMWNALKGLDRYAQKIDVQEIKIPINYKGVINSYIGDITILILEESFVLNSFIRPICINFDFMDIVEGQFGKVAGWGLTAEDGQPSPLLQTMSLPVVGFQICYDNSPMSFKPLITPDKICAGYTNGTALCNGDSGGGLVFTYKYGLKDIHYLFGIVSSSPRNHRLTACSAFAYTAFTNIRDGNIRKWFEEIWSTYNIV